MQTLALHLEAGSDLRQSLEALARREGGAGFVLSVVGNLSQAVFQCPGKAEPTWLRGELEIITLSGTLSPQGVHLHLSFSDGDCRVWGGHLEPGTLVLRGADLLVGFLPGAPAAPELPAATAAPSLPAPAAPLPAPPVPATATPAAPAAAMANARPVAPAAAYGAYAAGRRQSRRATTPVLAAAQPPQGFTDPQAPRVEIAVLNGCPWSERALRLLRTLAIPHRVISVESETIQLEIQRRSGSTTLPQVFVDGQPIGGYDALVESHARQELEPLRLR